MLITNIAIFAVYWLSTQNIVFSNHFADFIEQNFVMIPNEIIHGQRLFTLFTSMFMHASWLHLLGNMLYLYIFGDNIEDVFGHVGYLVFYVFSGLAAAFAHTLLMVYAPLISSLIGITIPADLTVGLIGASGAISGVLGAYLVLFPKAQILSIIVYAIFPVQAVLFLGFWFIMQLLLGVFDLSGGVAYYAHIGGFLAGVIVTLTIGLRRKKALKARFHM